MKIFMGKTMMGFNLRLNEGQKIYLRIHGDAYCSVSQAISILVDDEPFENAIHIHRYSTYIWKNAKNTLQDVLVETLF